MKVRRHHPAGVMPLELWDVLIDNKPLYLVPDADQATAIASIVDQLTSGVARRHRSPDTPLPRMAIDQVVVAGGGAVDDVVKALSRVVPAFADDDPVWIGECGGRSLLQATGANVATGLTVDVGQTSIKRSWLGQRSRLARDFRSIPLDVNARTPDIRLPARRATVAFMSSALVITTTPTAVVLALPCEIDDQLRVAGCSYPWDDDDTTLIPELLTMAGLADVDVSVLVLNDAELAAAGVAASSSTWSGDAATLVLTVGMGLGAAWLPRRS